MIWLAVALLACFQETPKPMATNRLAREKSPYLLQHASNPVDWYAWGKEAFERAKKEGKPIFLSVGYSTCHWCHVMERESFESEEVASILNRHFVSIKVDREERPDVDRVYMTFVQATTGSGGWPMSVWLTPDLKPFYGGTYFPPDSRWGRPGFKEILLKIAERWEKERDKVVASGEKITEALREQTQGKTGTAEKLDEALLRNAFRQFQASYDSRYGGFGRAPKFPRPSVFSFLLRYHARTGEKAALEISLHTLREMAKGGMYDQVGGGFHRYSTDERWHVPHFEKMLYDQGQLVVSYVEAFQLTKDTLYAAVTRDVLDYVLREMTSAEGGFYSAQDADSASDPAHPEEKSEGAFFVWSKEEIERILGPEKAEIFCFRFGASAAGNALNDPQGEFRGKNVLFQAQLVDAAAATFKKTKEEIEAIVKEGREKLFDARWKRIPPHLDDKILAAWNGLMISGFAKAAAALGEARYLAAAERAASFVLQRLREPKTGRLLRRFRDGEAAISAFGDDYAFLVQGLLDLYEASLEAKWLLAALELASRHKERFWDEKEGAFFDTTGEDPSVLVRTREGYDGAEPAPNSVAALNCLRLAEMTEGKDWRKMGESILRFFDGDLARQPHALPQMLAALDFSLAKPKQIVIAGRRGAPDTEALLRTVRERFLPNKILLLADGAESQRAIEKLLPFLESIAPQGGKATAFVCENFACKEPTSEPAKLAKQLAN